MSDLYNYVLRLADTNLILSHRLCENCGHGPYLEEDLAISNTALDLIGAGEQYMIYAAELSTKDVSADDLTYRRISTEYFNLQLAEMPNNGFDGIMARQFYFDVYNYFLNEELVNSSDSTIAAIAEKSLKEVTYHLRRSSEWIIRLGKGTEISKNRIQSTLNDLWFYTKEIFEMDEVDNAMLKAGIAPDLTSIKVKWENKLDEILNLASLEKPEMKFFSHGSKKGIHTEHLGFLLAEMQYIPRSFPDAKW